MLEKNLSRKWNSPLLELLRKGLILPAPDTLLPQGRKHDARNPVEDFAVQRGVKGR
jgi:hypothetical protein